MRWLLATVHLFAFAIGLGAVWARGRALQTFSRISFAQAALLVLMVLAATAMARGFGSGAES